MEVWEDIYSLKWGLPRTVPAWFEIDKQIPNLFLSKSVWIVHFQQNPAKHYVLEKHVINVCHCLSLLEVDWLVFNANISNSSAILWRN